MDIDARVTISRMDETQHLDLPHLTAVQPLGAAVAWAGARRSECCTPLYAQRWDGSISGTLFGEHPFWELTVAVAGSGALELRDGLLPLAAGSAVLVPPGMAHRERRRRGFDTVWIGLAGDALTGDLRQVHGDAGLATLALRLWRLAQLDAGTGPELDALALALVEALRRGRGAADGDLIDAAIERLAADLATDLGVAELALELRCSQAWLHRRFKQRTGSSPAAWRTRQRVEHALRLLAETRLSIREVALEVGYADPLHFSRVCRRLTGRPPSAWRSS